MGSVTCSFMQAFDLHPVFSCPSVLCVYAVISVPVHDPELPTPVSVSWANKCLKISSTGGSFFCCWATGRTCVTGMKPTENPKLWNSRNWCDDPSYRTAPCGIRWARHQPISEITIFSYFFSSSKLFMKSIFTTSKLFMKSIFITSGDNFWIILLKS